MVGGVDGVVGARQKVLEYSDLDSEALGDPSNFILLYACSFLIHNIIIPTRDDHKRSSQLDWQRLMRAALLQGTAWVHKDEPSAAQRLGSSLCFEKLGWLFGLLHVRT